MAKPQAVMINDNLKGCVNCQFEELSPEQHPCDDCSFLLGAGYVDRWQEKTCQTCAFWERGTFAMPCSDCQRGGGNTGTLRWKPKGSYAEAIAKVLAPISAAGESVPEQAKHTSAPDLLSEAASIMEERGKQYDQSDGERSMAKTVAAFNIITGHNLSEADGWEFMSVLKDVRLFSVREKTHEDSVKDKIAYGALLGEAAIRKGNLN